MGAASRIACLLVPALPLEALLRAEPPLRGAPLAVLDSDAARAAVLCASAEAEAAGVGPGMSAAAARAACGALVLRPRSPALERSALDALCDLAAAHAPVYERGEAGVLLGVGDLGRLFPSEAGLGASLWTQCERLGLRARVGLASGPRLSQVAARSGEGVTVIAPGDERRFLSGLPLDALEPGEALAARLRAFGVRGVADLAALPRPPLAMRLGAAGVQLHRLACGEDDAPLRPTTPPAILSEVLDLDDPLDNLEALAFLLRGALDRLVVRLTVRGQALQDYTLRLDLSPRGQESWPVKVAAPTRDVATLLRLGRAALQALPPTAPVRRVALLCRPGAPRPTQLDLFSAAGPSPAQLSAALARVQSLCKDEGAGVPAVPDTHLPGDYRVLAFPAQRPARPAPPGPPGPPARARLAPHVLRPPRPAEVIVLEGRPVALRAEGASGEVRSCGGPHRVRIGWGQRPCLRDYYDVELGDGGLWRLFQDLATAAWFLDARYD